MLVPQPATQTTLFRSADANEWLEAAEQHQPGVEDAPLQKIAGWSGEKLGRALAVVREARPSDAINTRLERAALLHADISLLSRKTGEAPSAESWEPNAHAVLLKDGLRIGRRALDPHIAFGRRVFAAMRAPVRLAGGRPVSSAEQRPHTRTWLAAHARNPRIRQWYRAVSADFAQLHWLADLKPHLDDAHGLLEDDAAHHFDTGCLAELLASPQVQHGLPKPTRELSTMGTWITVETKELTVSYNLDLAEQEYRDALKVDPNHDEARVRLARVLSLRGRHRDALALLEAPLTSREEPVRYFGLLMRADALERGGRSRDAYAAYALATGLFPTAQSALIPTIRLAREIEDDASGRFAAARMGALPRIESQRPDPWWVYYDCNGRNRNREVETLWQMFRERRQ